MTADAQTQEIIKLAAERHIDPYWSLRSVTAALKLAALTGPLDQVLWPDEQGGLAWEALAESRKSKQKNTGSGTASKVIKDKKVPAASKSSKSMESGRVICVGLDDRPHTDLLWNSLESHAAAAGREFRVYRLLTCTPPGEVVSAGKKPPSMVTAGENPSRYPGWVTRLLDRIFPQASTEGDVEDLPVSTTDRDGRQISLLPPPEVAVNRGSIDAAADGLSGVWTNWLAVRPDIFLIPCYVEIRERFLLARASSTAGFLPLVSLAPGEGPEASVIAQRLLLEGKRIIVRTVDDPGAVESFQVNTGFPLFTPASDSDLVGALDVIDKIAGDGESVFIVEPGRTALADKSALKTSWTEIGAPVVARITGGTAGSILIAAPGYHAAEAVKAAGRLSRENFSVSVISLRYLRPGQTGEILKAAENFDLVMFSDSGGGTPAVFSAEVLRLIAAGRESVTISSSPGNAGTIADNAVSALREQRFRRTVDDVRKDRWR